MFLYNHLIEKLLVQYNLVFQLLNMQMLDDFFSMFLPFFLIQMVLKQNHLVIDSANFYIIQYDVSFLDQYKDQNHLILYVPKVVKYLRSKSVGQKPLHQEVNYLVLYHDV